MSFYIAWMRFCKSRLVCQLILLHAAASATKQWFQSNVEKYFCFCLITSATDVNVKWDTWWKIEKVFQKYLE